LDVLKPDDKFDKIDKAEPDHDRDLFNEVTEAV